jgi:hypothetical protein
MVSFVVSLSILVWLVVSPVSLSVGLVSSLVEREIDRYIYIDRSKYVCVRVCVYLQTLVRVCVCVCRPDGNI